MLIFAMSPANQTATGLGRSACELTPWQSVIELKQHAISEPIRLSVPPLKHLAELLNQGAAPGNGSGIETCS